MYSISAEVSSHFEELKSIYRRLHEEPEILYDLPKTSSFVSNYLRDLGLEVQEKIGQSGVTASIKNPGPCIALRADMDALEIQEESGVEFASKTPGRMHACGHDAHVAMLLVAAKIIAGLPDLQGSVKFLFQPAEEGGAGALAMIKDGALEGVDEVYGIHTASGLKIGDFIYHDSQASVNSDRFSAAIIGRGGHGSIPHNTIDPVPVAAQTILDFNRLAGNRNFPARIQTNVVRSNETYNAIPTEVIIGGSVRSMNQDERDEISGNMKKICCGMEIMHRVKVDFQYDKVYDSVFNHPDCGKFALRAVEKVCRGKRHQVVLHIGEDFSYFANQKPAAFLLFGVNYDGAPSAHSSKFFIDEESLMIGCDFWVHLVKQRLGKGSD
jgi:hippurate hydrolase